MNLQHQGDYDARVYKTTDYGATWKLISASVPKGVNSSAHIIVEDPVRKGMLYLGTDNALYVTWDDGEHWTHLRNDLPPAPIYWMQVQPTFNDLVIGTHGRGVYILDDVTPLRTWDTAQSEDFHLFAPRPAYRFRATNDAREADVDAHVQRRESRRTAPTSTSRSRRRRRTCRSRSSGPNNATIRTLTVAGPPGSQSRVVGSALRVRLDDRDADAAARRAVGAGAPQLCGVRHAHSAGGADRAARHVHGAREGGSAPSKTAQLTVLPDPHSPGTPQSIQAQVSVRARSARRDRRSGEDGQRARGDAQGGAGCSKRRSASDAAEDGGRRRRRRRSTRR